MAGVAVRAPCFVLLAVLACCASAEAKAPPSETEYLCEIAATVEDGHFRIQPSSLHWDRQLGERMQVTMDISLRGDGPSQFASQGFDGVVEETPSFRFRFYPALTWRADVAPFAEIRAGDVVFRQTVWMDTTFYLSRRELAQLEAQSDDVDVSLYTADGVLLLSGRVPHAVLLGLEPTLRELHQQVLAMAADREHLCAAVVAEDIVVTTRPQGILPVQQH